MKQIIISGIIGAGLLLTGPAAMAHSSHGHHKHDFQVITPIVKPVPRPARHCVSGKRIDDMQSNQKHRIKKGKRQGKLVHWEVKQLKKQQRYIRKLEKQMRSSNHCLTKKEEYKLVKHLKRNGRKIRELKRNDARTGRGYHRHHRQ